MSQKTAINLILGTLGSGKTTLIGKLIQQKPANEKWGLLINEFGAVGLDEAILASNQHSHTNQVTIHQIPGGCICCTAKTELQDAIEALIEKEAPDRLIIEPTGLGEPDTLIDLLRTETFNERLEIQALISVFDSAHTQVTALENSMVLQSLLTMADMVVLNKTDLATPQQRAQLRTYCEALYPPKHSVIETTQGQIDAASLSRKHFSTPEHGLSFHASPHKRSLQPRSHAHSITTTLPYSPIALSGIYERRYQASLNTRSMGWIFYAETTFDWKTLFSQFERFAKEASVLRAKAIFKVGKTPRMLFQYVAGQATREMIAYRKDSRIELLLDESTPFDFEAFEQLLQNAIQPPQTGRF